MYMKSIIFTILFFSCVNAFYFRGTNLKQENGCNETQPTQDHDNYSSSDVFQHYYGRYQIFRPNSFRMEFDTDKSKLSDSTDIAIPSLSNCTINSTFDINCVQSDGDTTFNSTVINSGNVTVNIDGTNVTVSIGSNDTNHTESGIHIHVGGVSVDIDDTDVEVDTNNGNFYHKKNEKQVSSGGWYYQPPKNNGN